VTRPACALRDPDIPPQADAAMSRPTPADTASGSADTAVDDAARAAPRRWGWIAVAGLALLSLGQWLRESGAAGAAPAWLLGSWPNLAAAFAIPFVWLSVVLEIMPARRARQGHTLVAGLAVAGVGLGAWEAVQLALPKARFDPLDLAATGVGLLLAALAFRVGRRRG
jgi:hypothetical protein